MRVLPMALAGSLLTGCSMFDYDPANRPPPDAAPGVEALESDEPMTERWSREQRQCEVGDRDNQRVCIMGPPRE